MKTSILYASMPKLSSSYTQIPVFTAKPLLGRGCLWS